MRQITGHEVPNQAVLLEINAVGQPTVGGAESVYTFSKPGGDVVLGEIRFQDGTVLDKGVNGTTLEAVATVLVDRLGQFQAGPYANEYNAEALKYFELGRAALHRRTLDRQARGVEGKVVA